MTENVVSTTEVAPVKVPKSFHDLNKEQLVAAALAFGATETGTKEEIKADLLEFGVTFDQYIKMFYPDVEVVVEPEPFVMPESTDVNDWPDEKEGVNQVNEVITAAPSPALQAAEKYLIKFIGQNPYFEFSSYKFTQEKPYGIMPASDAQNALVTEPTKFRQAFPAELEEFYS